MFGIIGIKERDRHAPIVLGNVPDLRHLDGIVVVIMRIARRVVAVAAAEDEVLVALVDVQVGVPHDPGYSDVPVEMGDRGRGVLVGTSEERHVAAETIPQP